MLNMTEALSASGERTGIESTKSMEMTGKKSGNKTLFPWIKKRFSFRKKERGNDFQRPGLVLFSQRVVLAKTLSSLMDHRDSLTMTLLEGWVTDPNGVLPGSVFDTASQDGGDPRPGLTEVFYELSALDYCPDDKMSCVYLLSFHTHQAVLGQRTTQGESTSNLTDEAEQNDKTVPADGPARYRCWVKGKGRRKGEASVSVENTLVKMCSVKAERRCAKSKCLASKFKSVGDIQSHFDMLIENIFTGAFLAETNILQKFFKNDTIPVNANRGKSRIASCSSTIVLSPSVELHWSKEDTCSSSTTIDLPATEKPDMVPVCIEETFNITPSPSSE